MSRHRIIANAPTTHDDQLQIIRSWLHAHVLIHEGTPCYERLVLDHGIAFCSSSPGPKTRHRYLKACFQSAYHLMDSDPERYVYVEGFAYAPGMIPVHHAWAYDRRAEIVIDRAWDAAKIDLSLCSYFGIPFTPDTVRIGIVTNHQWGLFYDWRNRHNRGWLFLRPPNQFLEPLTLEVPP